MLRLGVLARVVVGVVWVVAGWLKLPDPAENVRAVRAYHVLPEAVVPTIGHLLPIIEIVVGACLLLGLLTRLTAVFSAALLVAFLVGISWAWARGLRDRMRLFRGWRGPGHRSQRQVSVGDRP